MAATSLKRSSEACTHVEHPLEVLVVLRVDGLDIVVGDLVAQDVLVEGAREVYVQQLPVVKGLADLDRSGMILRNTFQLVYFYGSFLKNLVSKNR